jgi:DNA-directed RNA polymerase I subunit RPA2
LGRRCPTFSRPVILSLLAAWIFNKRPGSPSLARSSIGTGTSVIFGVFIAAHSLRNSRRQLSENSCQKLGVRAFVFISCPPSHVCLVGFLCPVHTPDGSPCGLLNHLSRTCRIITAGLNVSNIPFLLVAQGMTQAFATSVEGGKNICVQLDGRVIGWARPSLAKELAAALRIWKTEGKNKIPLDLEIGLVMPSEGGQYPGLYLFSSRCRMMRPVKYVLNGRDDQVGSFEQVYMDIAITPEEIEPGVSTHVEHAPTNFMSILANMTPFSDFNQASFLGTRLSSADLRLYSQSPRNIYQCQVQH